MSVIRQQAMNLVVAGIRELVEAGSEDALDAFWKKNPSGQICNVLAHLWRRPGGGNPWAGHDGLRKLACAAVTRLRDDLKRVENLHHHRRVGYSLMHAYADLCEVLPGPDIWREDLAGIVRKLFLPIFHDRERVTVLSSANVGYGTNHLACELTGLTAYVAAFRDEPGWSKMDPGGRAMEDYVREWLARFMAHMDGGGYWPESDGPANAYNSLTANALLRAAMDLNEVENYRRHFERAAHFHTWYTLPNLRSVGVTDGRNHQIDCTMRFSFGGFIPEGKALLEAVGRRRLEWMAGGGRYTGEEFSEVLTDWMAVPFHTGGTAPIHWDRPAFDDAIRDDFAVFKRGPWMAAASGFVFRPRPEAHFTLDHQNLFTLYHERFGVLFHGNNSKNDPELATFNKAFWEHDGSPLNSVLWSYVPGRGRIERSEDGFAVWRDYRGFEGRVGWKATGPDSSVLELGVNARSSVYPVNASLQPAAGFGRGFETADGRRIEIGREPFAMTGREAGGAIVLDPEDRPDIRTDVPNRRARVRLPDDAEIVWPFKGWDCYNMKSDRYESPEQWTLLLRIPLGPDGVKLPIDIL